MTQDELKAMVGRAALAYVEPGQIVGVGTGSTVNHFIDALAGIKDRIPGAVSSSEASTARLLEHGIAVFDCNAVGELAVYIDGADEIDGHGCMIKGGGAALTREKIVAAQARRFGAGTATGRFSGSRGGGCAVPDVDSPVWQPALRDHAAAGGGIAALMRHELLQQVVQELQSQRGRPQAGWIGFQQTALPCPVQSRFQRLRR